MAGASFRTDFRIFLDNEIRQRILAGQTVWLLGYVDYQDAFDRRYRGRYGRVYEPSDGQNNLHIELTPGYNDDQLIEAGPTGWLGRPIYPPQ